MIAEDDSSWGAVYIHTDGLGSPVARTNASGALISRTRYEPYGNVAAGTNPTAPDNIGFTGHVSDAGTGLTYMQQRYYDPVAGRFMAVDPVVGATGVGFNRYAYAENSPYGHIDPDGRVAQDPQDLPQVVIIVRRDSNPWASGAVSTWVSFSAHATRAVVIQGAGTVGGMAAGAACFAILDVACGAVLPQVVTSGRLLTGALTSAALDHFGILQEGANSPEQSKDSKPQRPAGVPEDWKEEPGKKDGNTKWVNPNNPHDYVRSKPDGTVTQVRDGKAYDADGNRVDLKSPGAHGITPDQFIFRP